MGLHDSFSECANSPVLYRSFLFSLVRRCAHDAQGIALSSFPHHVPDGVVQLGERLAENGKVDGSSPSIVNTTIAFACELLEILRSCKFETMSVCDIYAASLEY
jgi:hypothetical protein